MHRPLASLFNNAHTRRAYMSVTRRFAAWCAQRNLDELSDVHPFHVAAFIKDLQAEVRHRPSGST
jgi:hypothetical protein